MSEETLLTAARRLSQSIKIDEAHGGLTSTDTHIALIWLKEIEKETCRQKAAAMRSEQEQPHDAA